MANTTGIFRAKVTTEKTDDSAPVVVAQTYPANQTVIVNVPNVGGPFIDSNGNTYPLGSIQTAKHPTGGVIQAGADITVAEFLVLEVATGAENAGGAGLPSLNGYTLSLTNPANESSSSGFISLDPASYAEGYDPKGIGAGAGTSITFTADMAGEYSFFVSHTAGANPNRIAIEINGTAIATSHSEDASDGDAGFAATAIAAGDVLRLRETTGNTVFGIHFLMLSHVGEKGADGRGIANTHRSDGVAAINGTVYTLNHFIIEFDDGTFTDMGLAGSDGQGIDHVSRTAGDGSQGTTDTYTIFADAAETISIGTYDVPIPADKSLPVYFPGSGVAQLAGQINTYYNDETIGAPPAPEANQEYITAVVQASSSAAKTTRDNAARILSHYSSNQEGDAWSPTNSEEGAAVERQVINANRGSAMTFGDLQFRVPSSGNSSLQFRVPSGVVTISNFSTKWSNQQGGASENNFNFSLGTSWLYFRANASLNLTLHNSYQEAEFVCNNWVYHVQVIVGSGWTNNKFSFTRWRLSGVKGQDGQDGVPGTDGSPGNDGNDGRGIVTAHRSDGTTPINATVYTLDHIIHEYTDGTFEDVGLLAPPTPNATVTSINRAEHNDAIVYPLASGTLDLGFDWTTGDFIRFYLRRTNDGNWRTVDIKTALPSRGDFDTVDLIFQSASGTNGMNVVVGGSGTAGWEIREAELWVYGPNSHYIPTGTTLVTERTLTLTTPSGVTTHTIYDELEWPINAALTSPANKFVEAGAFTDASAYATGCHGSVGSNGSILIQADGTDCSLTLTESVAPVDTPFRSGSGTRLTQNGVNVGGGTVTFPEAFKTGTTPTVMILPLALGDNVNATLQSVSETGFNAWIVRNESDVGQSNDIHWMAIGEAN